MDTSPEPNEPPDSNTPPKNDRELGPQESERLRQLSEALRQEFTESVNNPTRPTPSRTEAIKDLDDLKSEFLIALKDVLRESKNDSLRARVAMWGYDRLLDLQKMGNDPLAEFLKEMPTEAPTVNDPT